VEVAVVKHVPDDGSDQPVSHLNLVESEGGDALSMGHAAPVEALFDEQAGAAEFAVDVRYPNSPRRIGRRRQFSRLRRFTLEVQFPLQRPGELQGDISGAQPAAPPILLALPLLCCVPRSLAPRVWRLCHHDGGRREG
jgi:hypothetical protein